ncbi:hypothetical protein OJAV_G00174300 [Oryzias javanicus]|uniref:Chemokine interleukin-8-like domain-containing protein n=1 Tax=Oryzias javanicus TaxID=123683 RepID=A0A3S2M7X0_ORYJA|nr:hypothetical protein OJAV_G00174300 [Oryzias javanicus]
MTRKCCNKKKPESRVHQQKQKLQHQSVFLMVCVHLSVPLNVNLPQSSHTGEKFLSQRVSEFCPINAIIFHTRKHKICTDPALNWVTEYVERIRKREQEFHIG